MGSSNHLTSEFVPGSSRNETERNNTQTAVTNIRNNKRIVLLTCKLRWPKTKSICLTEKPGYESVNQIYIPYKKNYNSIKQKSQDVGYAAIFSFCCSEGGIGSAHCPFAHLPSPRFFPFSQSPTPPRFASARLFGALGTNKDGAHKIWLFSSRISSIWQG